MIKDYDEYCRGYLVWDYARGEIICTLTGEVVDRIIDYSRVNKYYNENRHNIRRVNIDAVKKHEKYLRTHRCYLRIYNKALNLVKNKPWLNVDFDKLFKLGKFVETLESENTRRALENMRSLGLLNKLEQILNIVSEIDPTTTSRTKRARLALAYMLYKRVVLRQQVDPREVTELFKISSTTFKRLEKIFSRIAGNIPREIMVKVDTH